MKKVTGLMCLVLCALLATTASAGTARLALREGGAPPETILLGETLQLVVAQICPHYVAETAPEGNLHALAPCQQHYVCDEDDHDMGHCQQHYVCEEGNHNIGHCGLHYICEGGNHFFGNCTNEDKRSLTAPLTSSEDAAKGAGGINSSLVSPIVDDKPAVHMDDENGKRK